MAQGNFCPRCGRPLERFNGRIGFCAAHNWVSPAGAGFDAEADQLNHQILLEKERKKKEIEEAKARKAEKERQSFLRLCFLIGVGICLALVAFFFFFIRPRMQYSGGEALLSKGEFAKAYDTYQSLGSFRDSEYRAALSQTMISLEQGESQQAIDQLEALLSQDGDALPDSMTKVLREMMGNWKASQLTPDILLRLLNRIEQIDPDGTLDYITLWTEAHIGLLDGTQTDVGVVATAECSDALVELRPDYSVRAYRMDVQGNTPIRLSNDEAAECETLFARRYSETHNPVSLECYAVACQYAPSNGSLQMEYALELAAQQDDRAADLFREAAKNGAQIETTVEQALTYFKPGMGLVLMRKMQMEALGPSEKLCRAYEEELITAIADWQNLSIPADQVPGLIRLAKETQLSPEGVSLDEVYRRSALSAAGAAIDWQFTDYDADGCQSLLTLDSDGVLRCFGLKQYRWVCTSQMDTGLAGASLAMVAEQIPVALVLGSDGSNLFAANVENDNLASLFLEEDIQDFTTDGTQAHYSRLLPGSIPRFAQICYTADSLESRPVFVGIDYKSSQYPVPTDAHSAVIRYFEARAYEISNEAHLLTSSEAETGFDLDQLNALAKPDDVTAVEASPFYTADTVVYFEVHYRAQNMDVYTWVAAKKQDQWRISGASDFFGTEQMDYSVPILNLNISAENTLNRNDLATYRVLIPQEGKLTLVWQYGTKAVNTESHKVAMYRSGDNSVNVFQYSLQPNQAIQQSQELYISGGIYTISVQTGSSGAGVYHLTLQYTPESNVELENNDTPGQATAIEAGIAYSGAFGTKKDVDYFSFTLSEPSEVNVQLSTSGNGRNSITYICSMWNATGHQLVQMDIPGNMLSSDSGKMFLEAGSYLVRMESGTAYSPAPYGLTVWSSPCAFTELECNDTFETATSIPVNQEIQGSIVLQGDVDVYRFTLEHNSILQPSFHFNPTGSSSKTYVLSIFNTQRELIVQEKFKGSEGAKRILPIALTAGEYYIRVENPSFVQQTYTLELTVSQMDAVEQEPNDSMGQATVLEQGKVCYGILRADTDQDYYAVSFSEATTVSFEFRFTQAAMNSTAFRLTVEQNGKRLWSANITGESGGIAQPMQFPAGTFYIRVQPASWVSSVYTIELK